MKLIKNIPELEEMPITFCIEKFNETSAQSLLGKVIKKAEEVIEAISDAYTEEWANNPSTDIRAVFGHWLVAAVRHFGSTIILCENHDLSTVADVHHRQMFEIFLQVRYYSSLDQDAKQKTAEKISAIGCIEYLEKMNVLMDHAEIQSAYREISDLLTQFDQDLIVEIKEERKKRIYQWFGSSFSQLAKNVNRAGEDLGRVYQIISTEVHGSWNLTLGVQNPRPGHLDFRGYPDKTTMLIRATEMLYQVTSLYMNLWNEIAESVGAQQVFYLDES